MSGDRVPFEQLIEDPNWKILFVDDLQMMQEEKDLQALCSLIREIRTGVLFWRRGDCAGMPYGISVYGSHVGTACGCAAL